MAIDLQTEKLVTFNDATRFLPLGMRPAYCTWWRWFRHGVAGVRLETVRISGRRLTSAEAVERFLAAVAAATSGEDSSGHPKTARHGFRAAENQLEREGI
jgi:hypothetical protein